MQHNIDEQELHAYVDGQLTPQRRQAVEEFLAAHPEQAAKVRDYQRQKEQLQALFAAVDSEPVPPGLRRAARGLPPRVPVLRYATAAAVLMMAGLGGWVARGLIADTPMQMAQPLMPPALVQEARAAHVVYTPEVRHPVEVAAAEEQHLVNWLSKRLDSAVRVPQLGAQGYQLVGGRLLPSVEGPAAQFMYQDAAGQRLTLYVRQARDNQETAFRYADEQGLGVFYWVDRELAYALSAELVREQLLAVASSVYEQLESVPTGTIP